MLTLRRGLYGKLGVWGPLFDISGGAREVLKMRQWQVVTPRWQIQLMCVIDMCAEWLRRYVIAGKWH